MAKRNGRYAGKVSVGTVILAIIIVVAMYAFDLIEPSGGKDIEGECEFHFVDVGQGDCAMIISEGGVVVIDAGPGDHAESTLEYIKSYTDKIDYLVLTHPHEDHIGGADEILENIKVENVIMSDASSDTAAFTRVLDAIEASSVNVIEAEAEAKYNAGDIEFTILSPLSSFTNYNDYSVVTKVEFGNVSAMITGDVEHYNEKLILDKYSKSFLKCDIYEISHHGSSTSNCEEFFDAVSPKFAVIQCGEGNTYGHPHRETVKELQDRNIEYFRSDEDGHIVFKTDGEDLEYVSQ